MGGRRQLQAFEKVRFILKKALGGFYKAAVGCFRHFGFKASSLETTSSCCSTLISEPCYKLESS